MDRPSQPPRRSLPQAQPLPPPPPPAPTPSPPKPSIAPATVTAKQRPVTKRPTWLIGAVGAGVGLTLLGGVLVWALNAGGKRDRKADAIAADMPKAAISERPVGDPEAMSDPEAGFVAPTTQPEPEPDTQPTNTKSATPTPAPQPTSQPAPKPEPKPTAAADKPAAKPGSKPGKNNTKPPAKPTGIVGELADLKKQTTDAEPNRFPGFASAVELPDPDNTEWRTLGQVKVQTPSEICSCRLLGGEKNGRNGQSFSLAHANRGLALREWEVTWKTETASKLVAKLKLAENQLQFAWTADAAVSPNVRYLQNCVLKLELGRSAHHVALRTPTVVEPVVIDPDRLAGVAKVKGDALPPLDSLRIRITTLDGFPKQTLDKRLLTTKDAKATIRLDGIDESLLSLRLEVQSRTGLELRFVAMLRNPESGDLITFSPKTLSNAIDALSLQRQLASQQADQAKKNAPAPKNQKKGGKRPDPRAAQAQGQVAHLDRLLASLKKLQSRDFLKNGKIHYEILYTAQGAEKDVVGHEFVLARG